MFCSRNKGADKAVHVTKSGYIHLQTCGKQSEFRDVPIISMALLILNSQPGHAFFLCVCGQSRRWRFSVGAQARLSLRCSHNWLIHEIKYVNIKFIKMQNHATINLFLGTCMCVCAYIIPVMHS